MAKEPYKHTAGKAVNRLAEKVLTASRDDFMKSMCITIFHAYQYDGGRNPQKRMEECKSEVDRICEMEFPALHDKGFELSYEKRVKMTRSVLLRAAAIVGVL